MGEVLAIDVALSIVRGLSGTENYPFHVEGEARLAEVLMKSCASVEHARAVVNEFDGDHCPSVEALRLSALRLTEKCQCGRPFWAHRDNPNCKRFRAESKTDEAMIPPPVELGHGGMRDSVPVIPGVPMCVCLQIECLRIAARSGQSEFMPIYERDYPEAVYDARRGVHPDPAYVERRMRELKPHMFTAVKGFKSIAQVINESQMVKKVLA